MIRRPLLALALLLLATAAQAQPAVTTPGGWFPPQGRLTLCSGKPFYDPQPATPSSTDTTAETTTFASAHGWCTGTMVSPSATGGNLTTGTRYWIRALSSTQVAYYSSLANAEADASRINLSASITAEIRPHGIQSSTAKYTCDIEGSADTSAAHCWVPAFTGTHWEAVPLTAEISYTASSTLISDSNYNLYLQKCGTTACLRLGAAWSGDTTPSETITTPTQSGAFGGVLSTDTTKLLVGLVRGSSVANDSFEDAGGNVRQISGTSTGVAGTTLMGRRFVYNVYNQRRCRLTGFSTTSHTYATNSTQAWNADVLMRVAFVTFRLDQITVGFQSGVTPNATIGARAVVGVGVDSSTSTVIESVNVGAYSANAVFHNDQGIRPNAPIYTPGYHTLTLTERAAGATTDTFASAYHLSEISC